MIATPAVARTDRHHQPDRRHAAHHGRLRVLLGGYGSGTYNLRGGALEIGGASLRGNFPGGVTPYAFNLGGGTVRVIGTALNTSVSATLASGTSSTIDTNGLGATWNGVLSGGGGLIKTGAGR